MKKILVCLAAIVFLMMTANISQSLACDKDTSGAGHHECKCKKAKGECPHKKAAEHKCECKGECKGDCKHKKEAKQHECKCKKAKGECPHKKAAEHKCECKGECKGDCKHKKEVKLADPKK